MDKKQVSTEEISIILASLRYLQSNPNSIPYEIDNIASNEGQFPHWKTLDIDDLCERISYYNLVMEDTDESGAE